MIALIAFIVTILIVVGVHEAGHYLAARACGVRVLRFAIGFGKPLLSRVDRNGTEWALGPLPFGGYVQMLETGSSAVQQDMNPDEALDAKPRWQRAIVVAAGPAANFILALVMFFVVALIGVPGLRAQVGAVDDPPSLAVEAGFQIGDRIVAIDGDRVELWSEVYEHILYAVADHDLEVEIDRNGFRLRLLLPLAQLSPDALDGDLVSIVGLRPDRSYLTVKLAAVFPDTPAALAGLRVDDEILALGGKVVDSWPQVVAFIEGAPNRILEIVVLRDGQQHILSAVPQADSEMGGMGKLGISPVVDRARYEQLQSVSKAGPVGAVGIAFSRTLSVTQGTFRFIGHLFGRRVSTDKLSGPLGIASFAGSAAAVGLTVFMIFLAHISISLGVLNLLPVPLLDGGHLLQYSIEGLLCRPLPPRVVGFSRVLGGIFIFMVMSLAIYNDVT